MNSILVLAIISTFGYVGYQHSLTPCDKVLEYSIGTFDNHFGISREQFIKDIKVAEESWETPLHKNVFEFKPNAKFTINLIYDERQQQTILKQRTESGLEQIENFFRGLDSKFNSLQAEYDSLKSHYITAKETFNKRALSYEQEINYWNSRNGAPPAKYKELETERIALNNEVTILNTEMRNLNELTNDLNKAVVDRNKAAEDYNKAVEVYNKKYGGHVEFNQAEYNGREINVYQFSDSKSLITALSHELGHALSLEHVENPKSIMYYLRENKNVLENPVLSAEDMAELKRVCKL